MKTINFNQIVLLLLTICTFSLFFSSCKKDNDSQPSGAPSVSKVTTTTDRSSGITTGSFTQWLNIYGSNLSATQSVSFNDQLIEAKDIYATDTMLTVQIPRAIPQNVNNKITVVTSSGTITYDFTVVIPDFKLTGFQFDYPGEGDTLVIVGENFDLYGFTKEATNVTFTGGQSVAVSDAAATWLKVVVPTGAEIGPITVKGGAPVNMEVTSKAWYKDNRNILLDMNNFGGWNGSAYISNGPDPAPFAGPYFKVAKQWNGGWAWDPFMSNNVTVPQELVDDASKVSEYALKFEMNISANTDALPQPINFVLQGNGFKDCMFNPTGQLPFNTGGKWQTFICPMSNFAGYTFKNPTILEMMLKYSDPFASNFAICNFRIVPN